MSRKQRSQFRDKLVKQIIIFSVETQPPFVYLFNESGERSGTKRPEAEPTIDITK
jgi:hypothetical protein